MATSTASAQPASLAKDIGAAQHSEEEEKNGQDDHGGGCGQAGEAAVAAPRRKSRPGKKKRVAQRAKAVTTENLEAIAAGLQIEEAAPPALSAKSQHTATEAARRQRRARRARLFKERLAQLEALKVEQEKDAAEGVAAYVLNERLALRFCLAQDRDAFASDDQVARMRILVLRRTPDHLLEQILSKRKKRGFNGKREPLERNWSEEELQEMGLIEERISSGFTVGVALEWDMEWWTAVKEEKEEQEHTEAEQRQDEFDTHVPLPSSTSPPAREPQLADIITGGVKVSVEFTVRFDEPDGWNEAEARQAELLRTMFVAMKAGGGTAANSNGSWLKGGKEGMMAVVGWRAAYERGWKLGTYAASGSSGPKGKVGLFDWSETAQDLAKMSKVELWEAMNSFAPGVYNYFASAFRTSYPGAYRKNTNEAFKSGIGQWGQMDAWQAERFNTFASNLTISYGGFANVPHYDRDRDSFTTFGCWWNSFHDELPPPNVEIPIQGGNIHLPEWRVLVNFSRTHGLAWMSWTGTRTIHSTTKATMPAGWDRFGSSAQVASSLFKRAQEVKEDPSLGARVRSNEVRRGEMQKQQQAQQAKTRSRTKK
ncbi:hypothetical protein JCM10213_007510 [Rhodosporidiobolus nylandii]